MRGKQITSYMLAVGLLGIGLLAFHISRDVSGAVALLQPRYLALFATFVVTDFYRTPLRDGFSGSFALAPVLAAFYTAGIGGAVLLNMGMVIPWVILKRRSPESLFNLGSATIATSIASFAAAGYGGFSDWPHMFGTSLVFGIVYGSTISFLSGLYSVVHPEKVGFGQKWRNLALYFVHIAYSCAFGLLMYQCHEQCVAPMFFLACALVASSGLFISQTGHRARNNQMQYEMIKALSMIDPLTGLYNYGEFHRALEDSFEKAGKSGSVVSLIYLDLDEFRDINNTCGHQLGDESLKLVANVLRSSCRENDSVFRPGGDEFTIILPGAAKEEAYNVVRRISENLLAVTILAKDSSKSEPLVLSASFGVATYPLDGLEAHTIIKRADEELYLNKNAKLSL